MGAIAFFGDKYGSSVRVVQAGLDLARVLRRHPRRLAGTDRRRSRCSPRGPSARTRAASSPLTGHASLERALQPGAAGARRGGAVADRARRAARGHRPSGRAPARRREGAVPPAPAVERRGGADAGGRGSGRQRGGRGPPRRRGARRAAEPGPGRPAPRRGAGRRARGLTRRAEGGHRRRDRRRRPMPPSSCAPWARWSAVGAGARPRLRWQGARTPRRSRRRWPRRSGFCPRERRRGRHRSRVGPRASPWSWPGGGARSGVDGASAWPTATAGAPWPARGARSSAVATRRVTGRPWSTPSREVGGRHAWSSASR